MYGKTIELEVNGVKYSVYVLCTYREKESELRRRANIAVHKLLNFIDEQSKNSKIDSEFVKKVEKYMSQYLIKYI